MAHADYHCCALCDGKMDYAGSGDATTKERLCVPCMRRLHAEGVMVYTGSELLGWLAFIGASGALKLKSLGWSSCWYDNPLDEAMKRHLGETPP